MQAIKQLVISNRNTPYNLLRLTRALDGEGVSILALHPAFIDKRRVVVLLVDKPRKAVRALSGIGYRYTEHDVIQVELSSGPDATSRIIKQIAREGTRITGAYRLPSSKAGGVTIAITV